VQYFWNVEAYGGGGGGGTSESWAFTTQIRPPVLVSPESGATAVTAVDLVWNRVPGAIAYGIEVGPNAAFNPIVAKVDGLADTTVRVRGLENNKRYFWRARAAEIDTSGPFSDRRSFVTGILTSITSDDMAAAHMRIEPHPVRERATVCTPFTVGGTWVLRITTIDGRDVRRQECDTACVELAVDVLAAGTYVLTVSSGSDVISRSLTIIK
jgi:hypothetical protein